MDIKIKPDSLHLAKWMDDNWVLYASQMHQGRMLCLYVNGNDIYRVVFGDIKHYEGNNRTLAIYTWNNI